MVQDGISYMQICKVGAYADSVFAGAVVVRNEKCRACFTEISFKDSDCRIAGVSLLQDPPQFSKLPETPRYCMRKRSEIEIPYYPLLCSL